MNTFIKIELSYQKLHILY